MAAKSRVNYICWVYRKIKRRFPFILLMSAVNLAVTYANIEFALSTKAVVNNAIARDTELLIESTFLMIGLCVFRLLGSLFAQFVSVNLQEQLERDFKRSIMETILSCDYSYISHYHSGDLLQRMDGDASSIYMGVMTLLSGLVGIIISVVASISVLMEIAPTFTIFFAVVGLLFCAFSLLFRRVLKQLTKDSSSVSGSVRGHYQEILSKLMVIHALDMGEQVRNKTEQVLDTRWEVRRKYRNINMLTLTGRSIISYGSYLLTMIWCGYALLNGMITYGDVTAITTLITTVRSAVMNIPSMIPRIVAITASCDRIIELEEIPRQPQPDPVWSRHIYSEMTGFTANDLCFSYDRQNVLEHVNLTIPKGGLTVIIGPSGIGKSTLLKLLLGLYKPNSGSLTVDTPAGQFPLDRTTRALFTYAPQGNFLLSGTLRENLTYANPCATEEQIQQALYVSAMDEYVASLPDGLQTILLENGVGLSEGQAQRISLARAVLSDAPVLLLDEVTSALDAATEQIVLERISALNGKTCIAVTHRPAALQLADYVIEVTENGVTITER